MRILVDILHPAHVHFFKHAIWTWQQRGHEILITVRDKDIAIELLESYGFSYVNLGQAGSGPLGLGKELVIRGWKLFREAKRFRPDVLIGIAGWSIAPVGRVIREPSVVFQDTEVARLSNRIAYPLASVICTPACYGDSVGAKQVRYDGYQELAYLHPRYFQPDSRVLHEMGLREGETFFILRLVAWGAGHDFRHHGFTNITQVVRFLNQYGRVLITSELELPEDLEKYRIRVSPEKIHHLLYYARMYLGESPTMASESALLGTPSIFVSTSKRGYTDELEKKYALVYTFSDSELCQQQALEKAGELLDDKELKQKWLARTRNMLKEKIDVTQFVVNFVERYPTYSSAFAEGPT